MRSIDGKNVAVVYVYRPNGNGMVIEFGYLIKSQRNLYNGCIFSELSSAFGVSYQTDFVRILQSVHLGSVCR